MEKSIKEIAWNVDEPAYRADPSYSYSTLSRFEREGFRRLDHLFDRIETPSLTFGSAVDSILTDGEDNFNSRFVVCDFPALSDSLAGITRSLHQTFGETCPSLDDVPDSAISDSAVAFNYYANPKYANYRVKSVRESCGELYQLLTLAGDRTVLSQSDYDDVLACVNELRTSPVTREFFTVNPFQNDIEKIFQLKFKSEYEGVPVRCMFDLLVVDHTNKRIHPVDLKTTGHPEEEFRQSFAKWRYDVQGKLYSYILQQVISKDDYFRDFKIMPYQFVVINRTTLAPVVWEFDGNLCQTDLKDEHGNVLRDWRKILRDLDWYLRQDKVKYSIEVQANNGRMKIDNLISC